MGHGFGVLFYVICELCCGHGYGFWFFVFVFVFYFYLICELYGDRVFDLSKLVVFFKVCRSGVS
jgi:hypothetical protein